MKYKIKEGPIGIIFNTEVMNNYNKIFILLLQIRRAKYVLDTIKIDNRNNNKIIHRMLIIKYKYLHFINTIQTYIINTVLNMSFIDFINTINNNNSTLSLDDLITIHNQYLNNIINNCLLHNKAYQIMDTIKKILNQSLQLRTYFDLIIPELPPTNKMMSDVLKLENEYQGCVSFLITILKSAVTLKKLNTRTYLFYIN